MSGPGWEGLSRLATEIERPDVAITRPTTLRVGRVMSLAPYRVDVEGLAFAVGYRAKGVTFAVNDLALVALLGSVAVLICPLV